MGKKLWLIDELAETRIKDAIQSGEFDHLAGIGERLSFDEDPLVPEDLRVAYRLLRMSGHLPPEITLMHEIRDVEQLVVGLRGGDEKSTAIRRLNLLRAQLGVRAEGLMQPTGYSDKVVNRLNGDAYG